ncbi:GNAT family N-acetyltransferase [Pelagerythrobacter marensis]|uniref:GNAT family N-acetyltransferase n=1 Tax=Pelagerythrobacter marensis TaxID=543877 RepID=A0ABZ2D7X1_9SPHN
MADFRHETGRLWLRDWRDGDCDDFHRVCGDPRVMATLGPVMSRGETAKLIADLQDRAARFGHTFWALERKSDGRVIGFTGLVRGNIAQIEGELEIGWRLAADCWGQGYAREAAEASLDWAKANRSGEPVVAITARANARSRALMERLGMTRRPERDFDHPRVPEGDPLRPHVLYAIDPGARR